MKRSAVLSLAALVGAIALTALPGPSAAADAVPGTGSPRRTVTVSDPRGDVLDAGSTTRKRARKLDVTSATYSVVRDTGIRGGEKRTQSVTFEVEHVGYIPSKATFGCRARLTVTFVSGDREYKATSGDAGLQSRTPGGVYEDAANTSYGYGCGGSPGGGTAEIDVPAKTFRAGTITDIRATLRLGGSRARDVVIAPIDYLQFAPK